MTGVTASKRLGEEPARFEVRLTSDSHFAWLRTRLSLERTLMSWVRTAVALIGFGFTIVQFFQHISQIEGVKAAVEPEAPRYLGLALIATGIVALAISVWQYRVVIKYLSSADFRPLAGLEGGPEYTPLYAVAIVLMFIGLFAFFAVFTRAL